MFALSQISTGIPFIILLTVTAAVKQTMTAMMSPYVIIIIINIKEAAAPPVISLRWTTMKGGC
jgi:hypothetical protein